MLDKFFNNYTDDMNIQLQTIVNIQMIQSNKIKWKFEDLVETLQSGDRYIYIVIFVKLCFKLYNEFC